MEADRYYVDLASAFVRGKLGDQTGISAEGTIRAGITAGLKLHKFKRNAELPRVRKVLGILLDRWEVPGIAEAHQVEWIVEE